MLFLYGTEIFLSFAVRVFSRVGYKSNLYKKEGEGSVGIDVDGFGSDIFYGEDIICIFVIVIVKYELWQTFLSPFSLVREKKLQK